MSTEKLPLISVVLPVYNGEGYLRESVDSILNQTFSDFEFIILNDGSTDRSEDVILSYKDPRIKYHKHLNCGLAATLNKGIDLAKGKYIARQDQDDISLPERLQKQIDFMESNPTVALLGTNAEIINEKSQSLQRFLNHAANSDILKFDLLFDNPFVHSSIMFRKAVIEISGNYMVSKEFFEDHNLWSRMARQAPIANLPDCLVKYREVSTSISRTIDDYKMRVRNQSNLNIKYYCTDLETEKINKFTDYIYGLADYGDYKKTLNLIREVLEQIVNSFSKKENINKKIFEDRVLVQLLNFKRHCYNKVIFSDSYSVMQKTGARIKRKIMFLRYGKLLH
jgi:glycosyltransferase involved in cell wall biosynthesis